MSYRGDMNKIRKAAIDAHWRIEKGNRHEKWWPADKTKNPVIVHCTQCGGRAWENMVAQLRRAGLKI